MQKYVKLIQNLWKEFENRLFLDMWKTKSNALTVQNIGSCIGTYEKSKYESAESTALVPTLTDGNTVYSNFALWCHYFYHDGMTCPAL